MSAACPRRVLTVPLCLQALKGDPATQHGILDQDTFDANWKSANKRYEEYLLTCGNFDERTFLGEHAGQEIGTPSKANNYSVTAGDLAERMQVHRSLMLAQDAQVSPCRPLGTAGTGPGRGGANVCSRLGCYVRC